MTTVYSAAYGGYDAPRPQPVPVRMFTDRTHPLPGLADPRMAAKWWKLRPDLAVPEDEVTVWVDAAQDIRSASFADEMEALLGDDEMVLFRHETRDDIHLEVIASRRGLKYDPFPLEEQALEYRIAGHPDHWGMAHACLIVRRNTPAVRAFDEAWWAECERWSPQDQVSLPHILRQSGVRWRWAESPVSRWLAQQRHSGADAWRRPGGPLRHYVLTRSAYAPDYPIEQNRARLELLRRVTAPSLAAQSERDVTWLVLVDPKDPLLAEREAALASSGLRVLTGDAGRMVRTGGNDRPQGPWARHIRWDLRTAVATARLDDDDALPWWGLSAVRAKLEAHNVRRPGERRVMTLPAGWRVAGPNVDLFDMPRMMNWDEGVPWISQYSTLYAPPGDAATMLDVRHGQGHLLGALEEVTKRPAWLWLRHEAARSNGTRHSRDRRDEMRPPTAETLAEYPTVDWDFVATLPAG